MFNGEVREPDVNTELRSVLLLLFPLASNYSAFSYGAPNYSSPWVTSTQWAHHRNRQFATLLDVPSLVHLESVRPFFLPFSPLFYHPATLMLHM